MVGCAIPIGIFHSDVLIREWKRLNFPRNRLWLWDGISAIPSGVFRRNRVRIATSQERLYQVFFFSHYQGFFKVTVKVSVVSP